MNLVKIIILIVATIAPLHLLASDKPSLNLKCLDSCIAKRPLSTEKVEKHIAGLKQQLRYTGNDHRKRLRLLNDIYQAYYSYQFDSALVYVKQCYDEAMAVHDEKAAIRAQLYKVKLLAIGGFYNGAEEILRQYKFRELPADLRYDYAIGAYWTYVYWSAFTMDAEFSTRMDSLRTRALNAAISYCKQGSATWYYLKGEQAYFLDEPPAKALHYYKASLKRTKGYGRPYSQCAFAMARAYKQLGNDNLYAYYLFRSSKSDLLAAVKENAALQDLAMYIFHQDPDKATLAHHYLLVAMDDATFYNNKLRKLEISNRLPPIMNAYQQQLSRSEHKLLGIVIIAMLLAIGALVLYLITRRRNAQLHLSHKLLEHKNTQLHAANTQMQKVNSELSKVNSLLREANHKREEYLRLFVDLCASTMNRITSYRNLVRLKIKAKQTEDLLRTVNSDRLVNRDMTQFFIQFDKAFLGLYPNFVDEFSKLLQPDYQVSLNKDGSMSTDLRIFAFIRLGVTESSEIATLLSYSPHTIYNYRSAMKSHAMDKEHFEDNVKQLCIGFNN